MSIYLEYHYVTEDISDGLNWTTWVDPKTCLLANNDKGAAYIGFKGPGRVNAADLAVLCYMMHADCDDKRAGFLAYMTGGCYCHYVDLKDREAIVSALIRAIGFLAKEYPEEVKLIKQQLPWLLINPDWHSALLAAPEKYIKRCREADLRRRPETYAKLQKQADRLHEELRKTIKAMFQLKAELPELPPVPSYKAV